MTKGELEELLDRVVPVLESLRELMTPEDLESVRDAVDFLFGESKSAVAKVVQSSLAAYAYLLSPAGESLIRSLSRLRNRPILLRAVAALF